MKILFTFLFAIITLSTVKAQDLIVTTKNDSIQCKILEIDSDMIKYANSSGRRSSRITSIDMDEVKNYVKGYYSEKTDLPVTAGEKAFSPSSNSYKQSRSNEPLIEQVYLNNKLSFSIEYGRSYRIAALDEDISDFEDYFDDMRWGPQVGTRINYFFWDNIGLGFVYHYYNQSNELVNDNGIKLISDNISMNYFGPSYIERYFLFNNKILATIDVSLGYMSFYNDGYAEGRKIELSGGSFAYALNATANYFITHNMSIGANLNFYTGVLKEIELKSGNEKGKATVKESLAHVGFTAVFQIYFD